MVNEALYARITELEKKNSDDFEYISDFIYKNPELGMEEQIASRFLCGALASYGYEVTRPYAGHETAFMAELKNGQGPTIAVIAEYDALPEFGPGRTPGHACGHNWISSWALGAAKVLSELKDEFSGTIRVIGTPGMENVGYKVNMLRRHVFDDVDVVIMFHLEKYTSVACKSDAMDYIEFTFEGVAAHASQHPEDGVNALNAVHFTFMGVNALKNNLSPDLNINGIITEGGTDASVIPSRAVCRLMIRSYERSYLNKIRNRIINCAEGAAIMSGTKMSFRHFENALDEIMNNPVLSGIAGSYLAREGIEVSETYKYTKHFGSTDLGNVSHFCPTLYVEVAMEDVNDFAIHSMEAMKYVNSQKAYQRMHQCIRMAAGTVIELFNDRKLLEDAKQAHRRESQKYMV